MAKPILTAEDRSILKLYAGENITRQAVMEDLTACLDYTSDNEIWHKVNSLISKVDALTDSDFAALQLSDAFIED